jgi:hypothetical protein
MKDFIENLAIGIFAICAVTIPVTIIYLIWFGNLVALQVLATTALLAVVSSATVGFINR